MDSLHRMGRRRAAIEQFHSCSHILDEEPGVAPSAETRALYDGISGLRKARPVG